VHGWRIVSFAQARARAAPGDLQAKAVRPWIAETGLAVAALETSLAQAADAADAEAVRRREADLAAILSVAPLSSTHWLSLAGLRLVAAHPYEQVVAALTMSWVTGGNEGGLMLQRGLFGLLQWEVLPGDARKRTIADIAGVVVGTSVQDVDFSRAKSVLGGKSPDMRREVSDLLRAQGVSPADLARMGL